MDSKKAAIVEALTSLSNKLALEFGPTRIGEHKIYIELPPYIFKSLQQELNTAMIQPYVRFKTDWGVLEVHASHHSFTLTEYHDKE